MSMKPMLFNTNMVRALQANRKTETRRVVKPRFCGSVFEMFMGRLCETTPEKPPRDNGDGTTTHFVRAYAPCKAPYRPGDILYVRETWRIWRAHRYDADAHIEFKAGGEGVVLRFPHGCTDSANRDDYDSFIHKWGVRENKWHPSIHMPREAARIFLRVTDVRAERLQDITDEDLVRDFDFCPKAIKAVGRDALAKPFWNSTINPSGRKIFGWDANPWVWVIEFERVSREEAMQHG